MKSTELKYWRPGISTKALARLAAPALLAVLSMSASCGGDGEVVAQECEGTVCPCNEAGIRDAISKGGGSIYVRLQRPDDRDDGSRDCDRKRRSPRWGGQSDRRRRHDPSGIPACPST